MAKLSALPFDELRGKIRVTRSGKQKLDFSPIGQKDDSAARRAARKIGNLVRFAFLICRPIGPLVCSAWAPRRDRDQVTIFSASAWRIAQRKMIPVSLAYGYSKRQSGAFAAHGIENTTITILNQHFGFVIRPESLNQWFSQSARQQKDDHKEEVEKERFLDEGTPEYLDWLSQSASHETRKLAEYARRLDDVSLNVVKQHSELSPAATFLLALVDVNATDISRECVSPFKLSCRATKFRSFSGECNNVGNPHWGKALTPFSRSADADYSDRVAGPRSASAGLQLPSARAISRTVNGNADEKLHKYVNQMLVVWAQLVEADTARPAYFTENSGRPLSCCADTSHPECFPIFTKQEDRLEKLSSNISCMHYIRSLTSPEVGCRLGVRQQVNTVSHWLDASTIYGSTDGFQSFFDDKGGLWMSESKGSRGIPQEVVDDLNCYRPNFDGKKCMASHASKIRGSGYGPLSAVKTILMREHNRIAKVLTAINAHWDSARVFQVSRQILIAQLQHITYKEFLPLVVGPKMMEQFRLKLHDNNYYKGYDLNTDPSTENAFAVAASRFWMELIDSKTLQVTSNGTRTSKHLRKEFFNSPGLADDGTDNYIRGLLHQAIRQKGHGVTTEISDHWLQGPLDLQGLDLVALTVQRGRDHGIPSYNAWRESCGILRAKAFADLVDVIPSDAMAKLEEIYESVDDIDLFTGGLAEKPLKSAVVGPVFACILGRQYTKLRHTDRFWYEMDIPPSSLTINQLNEVRKASLSRLICDNANNISSIQPQAMLQPDDTMNSVVNCHNIPAVDLSQWREQTALFNMLKVADIKKHASSSENSSEVILKRVRRQGFGGGGNFRQNRQLRPVNQFQNIQSSDNSCGEKSRACDASSKFRTISGHCNNIDHPEFGQSDRVFTRFVAPVYDDGTGEQRGSSVMGGALPPVRAVRTNVLTDVDRPHPKYTTLLMQFGQFMDHDFTNTPMATTNSGGFLSCKDCNSQQTISNECRPIRVPQGDPIMAANDRNGAPLCLSFTRSMSRTGIDGRRQQVNQLTSFLDASVVYGSSACLTRRLRSFSNGQLSTTTIAVGGKDLLLQSTSQNDVESQECRSTGRGNRCFMSGDARSNEQPGLAVFHTIWVREHNRIAAGLKALNSHWDDSRIFDEARRIIIAELQHVAYNEWLPRVVGQPVTNLFGLSLKRSGFYDEYDDTCDAGVSNEFSTAAFRFGHSLVPARLGRYDNTFQSNRFKPLNLFEQFSRSDALYEELGVDKILIGLTIEPTQNADFSFVDALANHLFQDPNRPLGTDLVAINIQRGRDHGLAGYNAYRERCNMSRANSFNDLSGDIPQFLVDKLSQIYRHVDDIDLFAGGTCELPVVGGLVGPTFACIIGEQYLRLRKCDRFWYETADPSLRFTAAQLAAIRRVSMAKIVCQNSDTISQIQKAVFDLPDTFINSHVSCDDVESLDLTPWQEVSACAISGQRIEVGATRRVSPCVQCSCTLNGPDCRSLHITSCKELAQDFTEEQILNDDVCKVQCTKDISDSAADEAAP